MEKNNNEHIQMHYDIETVLNDKKKYASLFCEGNSDLYAVLMKLWNNGFKTVGCCGGHNDNSDYVGIALNKNKKQIINLLSAISKKDICIVFTAKDDNKNISIKKRNKESNNNIFKEILEVFDKNEIDEDIVKITNYIMDFKDGYINIRLYFENGKMDVYVNTDNQKLIAKLKTKYDNFPLNEKCGLHHFIIQKH